MSPASHFFTERLIQYGLLVLVALMPFHAFLSVWLGHLTGHQAVIQSWKEALAVVLAGLTILLLIREPTRLHRLHHPVAYLAAAFALVALIVTVLTQPPLRAIIFGLKTDLEFLLLALIAWLVANRPFVHLLVKTILITGAIAATLALLLALFLPPDFLTRFGYGPDTIAPYRLVDPAINTIRTPGTLGGPNQLGSFLILPLCLLIALATKRWIWWLPMPMLLLAGGVWVSYSRSAWLGLLAGILTVIAVALPWKRALTILGLLTLGGLVALVGLIRWTSLGHKLQYYLLHAMPGTEDRNNSTFLHAEALRAGLEQATARPLGQGLGTAGPASIHSTAPFIPENYYLQIAIETGWLGAGLFVALLAALGRTLWGLGRHRWEAIGVLGALVGISVINLFLHGWADSSTAFVFWILTGALIGEKNHV